MALFPRNHRFDRNGVFNVMGREERAVSSLTLPGVSREVQNEG